MKFNSTKQNGNSSEYSLFEWLTFNFNPKWNQNDVVDNFAFISVLTDSLFSSLLQTYFIPDLRIPNIPSLFFFIVKIVNDICILNWMSISIFRLCYYAHTTCKDAKPLSSSKFGYPEIHQKISVLNRNDREITNYYVLTRIDLTLYLT